jgi:hypothetical protein
MRRLVLLLPLVLPSSLLAGCAEDFVPGSVVEDLRVLALPADPPELGLGETVTVRAVTAAPGGAPPASVSWSFCPLTLGPQAAYRCIDPRCELPLVPAADGSVTADPVAAALACAAALGGVPGGGGAPGTVPETVEAVVRYLADDGAGLTREAVQRVTVWTAGPPPARNANPVITGVEIGGLPATPCPDPATCPASGRLPAGGKLALAVDVDPASLEAYVDGAGRTLTESVVVSFFTTAGRFTGERGQAPRAETELEATKLAAGTAEALLWVVARDLRGGEAAAGPFLVTVEP